VGRRVVGGRGRGGPAGVERLGPQRLVGEVLGVGDQRLGRQALAGPQGLGGVRRELLRGGERAGEEQQAQAHARKGRAGGGAREVSRLMVPEGAAVGERRGHGEARGAARSTAQPGAERQAQHPAQRDAPGVHGGAQAPAVGRAPAAPAARPRQVAADLDAGPGERQRARRSQQRRRGRRRSRPPPGGAGGGAAAVTTAGDCIVAHGTGAGGGRASPRPSGSGRTRLHNAASVG
jgi:hypothetical protein